MPVTYDKLATTTLSSATSSITFSSISQSYTDLVITGRWRDTTNGSSLKLRFNGDTATNYSVTYLYATTTTSGGARNSNRAYMYGGEDVVTSSSFASFIWDINNYSNTNIFKNSFVRNYSPGGIIMTACNLWRNTQAISSITIFVDNNMPIGTMFTIYGILKA